MTILRKAPGLPPLAGVSSLWAAAGTLPAQTAWRPSRPVELRVAEHRPGVADTESRAPACAAIGLVSRAVTR